MYSSQTFARLTGITTKSLRHYERVGILSPTRTAAGYRRYSSVELSRVYQTLALKSLGFSLKVIKTVLDGRTVDLIAHRERLLSERTRLTQAIDALRELPAQPDSSAALKTFVAEFIWNRAEATRKRTHVAPPIAYVKRNWSHSANSRMR
jgi:DNA-binding transcriptional MerR regulator